MATSGRVPVEPNNRGPWCSLGTRFCGCSSASLSAPKKRAREGTSVRGPDLRAEGRGLPTLVRGVTSRFARQNGTETQLSQRTKRRRVNTPPCQVNDRQKRVSCQVGSLVQGRLERLCSHQLDLIQDFAYGSRRLRKLSADSVSGERGQRLHVELYVSFSSAS